jgi:hypothetical protein
MNTCRKNIFSSPAPIITLTPSHRNLWRSQSLLSPIPHLGNFEPCPVQIRRPRHPPSPPPPRQSQPPIILPLSRTSPSKMSPTKTERSLQTSRLRQTQHLAVGFSNSVLQRRLFTQNTFTGQEFSHAAELYTRAIEHNPTDATIFCNRAYARMKLEEHGYAIGDCSTSYSI